MEVAEGFRRRYRFNARVVLRYAHGWSQRQAADEWNRRWPDELKTFKSFSSWEQWPSTTGHIPSFANLTRLAELYECAVSGSSVTSPPNCTGTTAITSRSMPLAYRRSPTKLFTGADIIACPLRTTTSSLCPVHRGCVRLEQPAGSAPCHGRSRRSTGVPCQVAAREAGRRPSGHRRGDRAARPSPLNTVTYLGCEHTTSRTWRVRAGPGAARTAGKTEGPVSSGCLPLRTTRAQPPGTNAGVDHDSALRSTPVHGHARRRSRPAAAPSSPGPVETARPPPDAVPRSC